jgi:hypothetical protein
VRREEAEGGGGGRRARQPQNQGGSAALERCCEDPSVRLAPRGRSALLCLPPPAGAIWGSHTPPAKVGDTVRKMARGWEAWVMVSRISLVGFSYLGCRVHGHRYMHTPSPPSPECELALSLPEPKKKMSTFLSLWKATRTQEMAPKPSPPSSEGCLGQILPFLCTFLRVDC